jgi:hypothetical protein
LHALRQTQRNDPAWRARFRAGLGLLLAGQAFLIGALFCSIANDFVHWTYRPFFLWTLPLVVMFGAAGAWMLSTPALFAQCDRWWSWVRRSVRVMVAVTTLAGLLLWINEYRGFTYWFYPLSVLVVIWSSAIALTFAYLSASADQLGSLRVAMLSRHVMWALPLGMIAPPIVAVLVWMMVRPLALTPTVVGLAIVCATWFLASYSTAVAVLVRLRQAIDDLFLQATLGETTA